MRTVCTAAVFVCLFASFAIAQTVEEKASLIDFRDGRSTVQLSVDSPSAARNTRAKLELLDPRGEVRAQITGTRDLAKGNQTLEFQMQIPDGLLSAEEGLGWYRLRYEVGSSKGVIAVSEIARELFELRIIATSGIMAGTGYRVRVRAMNPFSEAPTAGVELSAELALDKRSETEDRIVYSSTGVTDNDGFAVMDFAIPAHLALGDDGEITVTGRRNGIVRAAEKDLSTLERDLQFLLTTDKPIYQPQQTLKLRGILIKGYDAYTVLAGEPLEFRVYDEDGTLLYRESSVTSSFGIGMMTWRIPANAKLGQYRVEVLDDDAEAIAHASIKVSRYDLPNFVVNAKVAKPYYLPGDNEAEVEIRADYLFGKPITKGKVRVVREKEREWNYREQKYDISEGEAREGVLDTEHKFTAKFDLSDAHSSLADNDWRKHLDLQFAAYVTDETTNRTEQRRFDVRVSREAIHVYLVGLDESANPLLPLKGYVSTFYADGSPAVCRIEIKARENATARNRAIASIRTNEYGVGRFEFQRPDIGRPTDTLDFSVDATDSAGKKGTIEEKEVWFDDDDSEIQISTDRTIYKPGETIRVDLRSTIQSGLVYVDIVDGWTVIGSHFADLKNGRAELSIPYNSLYKGELTVAAFVEDTKDVNDLVVASRGIIFPAREGLEVRSEFVRSTYKPNEEASANFSVFDSVSGSVESALGIVIRDKAVDERARTDADFGSMASGFDRWLGYGKSFAGINVKDLNALDLSKRITPELQLAAEMMLHDSYYRPELFHSRRYFDETNAVFGPAVQKQLAGLASALADAYKTKDSLHPTNKDELRQIAASYGIDSAAFLDPWGVSYRTDFSVEKELDRFSLISAGPDKSFGTRDDMTAYTNTFAYFTPTGRAIDAAVAKYHERTGSFVRDENTLLEELGMDAILDRWGRPYRVMFGSEGRKLKLSLRSMGPNGRFEGYAYPGDDFPVWSTLQDPFQPIEERISRTQEAVPTPPISEAAFRAQLKEAGITEEALRDAEQRPLHISVVRRSRYADRASVETLQVYGDETRNERVVIVPVTQDTIQFTIRGAGKDATAETYDDVIFMQVIHVLTERSKDDPRPVRKFVRSGTGDDTGSIAGVVTDMNGAVIPAVSVIAKNDTTTGEHRTTTDSSGRFEIIGLAAGRYTVTVYASGFKMHVMRSVPVSVVETEITIALEHGEASVTVDVTASALEIDTATASSMVESRQIAALPLMKGAPEPRPRVNTPAGSGERETPRVRGYFPETLLWQPEVITGADGKATVKFRMADNITTWKMYTIASTKNGKIGFAENEVTAFQSFFVDLDPPKFLTSGDEIFLPAQIRNYTEKDQSVDVTMSPADWFEFIDGEKKQVDVPAGEAENAVFGFRPNSTITEGKQRVTAIADSESDAIERPVTVRPDGREIVAADSRYFENASRFEVNFPANAFAETRQAELKIYPNMLAHVAESVEGLLQRPYGCGEQTISSTYPNLMILKFAGTGEQRRISKTAERQALKNLQDGYERLLGYQAADGGFTYWGGRDEADLALTAYALRFLADASATIAVDPGVVKKAETWLIAQQLPEGSWVKKYRWETAANAARSKTLTAYIARTLAMLKPRPTPKAAEPSTIAGDGALDKALKYLQQRDPESSDPYLLALAGLALHDAGKSADARLIADKLVTLGRDEAGGSYWNLESNTVFNGWGNAGRIETTALAAQLFLTLDRGSSAPQYQNPSAKAMLFLIKNKDRYGVWYSTQTSINVLDAFIASLAGSDRPRDQSVDVVLNGDTIETVSIGPDKLDQIVIDLGGKLSAAANILELRASDGSPMMAQVVSTYYIPWADANLDGRSVNASRAVSLEHTCDRTEAAIMQEITCSVAVERTGFRGYGMLLAEIGIPPGADVSRESLEAAMGSDWSLSKYELLPDRVIVYMWAKAGGTKFNFKFRPRYGINARTPASFAYDYYNPEAQAVNAPLRFRIR